LSPENSLFASIPYVHRFESVAIVSPRTGKLCFEKEEGEIWLCSPAIARGYWNRPELTKEVFQNSLPGFPGYAPLKLAVVKTDESSESCNWLRTGDLGYMENGHLFVSGRLKDLIIINGKNLYPQDIELRVQQFKEELGVIRPGCVAVFAVIDLTIGSERFVVVCEVRNKFLQSSTSSAVSSLARKMSGGFGVNESEKLRLEEFGNELHSYISQEFQGLQEVVFIKEKSIPKTTSGKLKRSYTKELWMTDKLTTILKISSSPTAADDPCEIRNISLLWIEPIIEEIIGPFGDVISLPAVQELCFQFLSNHQIYERDLNLSNQGIDSIKVGELYYEMSHHSALKQFHAFFADASRPVDDINNENNNDSSDPNNCEITNMNSLFEWTGKDLIVFLVSGRLPVSASASDEKLPTIFSSTVAGDSPLKRELQRKTSQMSERGFSMKSESLSVEETNDVDIQQMCEKEIRSSYSMMLRVLCESIGIVLISLTIVASLIPSIFFFNAFKDLGGTGNVLGVWRLSPKHDPNHVWLSYGAVLILCSPIFTISFTMLVILQRIVLWKSFLRTDFIPIHSLRYYVWWYIDRLLNLWENTVFLFISGTPLVNLVYFLMGATSISPFATISFPIRVPDLVSIGEGTTIDGYVLPYSISPLGVSFAAISIGHYCTVGSLVVIQEGSIVEGNVRFEQCSVVPRFTRCEGNYVWGGKPCSRGAIRVDITKESSSSSSSRKWFVERIARLLFVFSLPWGSMISLACANRFWFVVFPANPPSNRIGNFWMSVWLFYGTQVGWIIFVLLFKWIVFGKAKEGPYHPGVLGKILRWGLGYYTSMVEGLFFNQFFFPIVQVWSRLMGQSIHPTAAVVHVRLAHPADTDLVEIAAGASVSWIDVNCYDSEKHERSKVKIGKNSQVWFYASLDAGSTVSEGSVVSSATYCPPHGVAESGTIFIDPKGFSPKRMNSKKTDRSTDASHLYIPDLIPAYNPFLIVFVLILDATVVVSGIIPFWLMYYLYRLCTSDWKIDLWISLIIVIIFGFILLLTCYALVHRVYTTSRAFCLRYPASVLSVRRLQVFISFAIWKMVHQYRSMLGCFFVPWNGTIFFNVMLKMGGAQVALSSKIFCVRTVVEWAVTVVDEFAVVAEDCALLGHQANNFSLTVGTVTCGEFSCLETLSLTFEGNIVESWACLGPLTASKKVKSAYYQIGGRIAKNPVLDDSFEVSDDLESDIVESHHSRFSHSRKGRYDLYL
jgi:carbonic anhydrase/acetyltransferase-like protein (isoleucine patch superfamily)